MVKPHQIELESDLAPNLPRQRVVIEGTTPKIVEPLQIADYLEGLSGRLGMTTRDGPLTYSAEDKGDEPWTALYMGYAGWLYWVSSGVHFHSYPTDPPLFTVDAYTCKLLDIKKAVNFTREFFQPIQIVWYQILQGPTSEINT